MPFGFGLACLRRPILVASAYHQPESASRAPPTAA